MARIQVLELPTKYDGDVAETPFVLIIDKLTHADEMSGIFAAGSVAQEIKREIGAAAIISATGTLDVG